MSNILNLIYTNYLSKYTRIILIVALAIIFLYVGYNVYKTSFKKSDQEKEFSDVANANKRKRDAQVLFFFADWCPHCRKAKPEWEQFKEEYDGKVINEHLINCLSVDCTDEKNQTTAALIKKHNIESYPTIIMLVGDNKIDYEAKVTKSGLEQLVLSGTSK